MERGRVVIVGAGPAGMSAALVLAEAGARPVVLDENPRIGGQIYRQPPPQRPRETGENGAAGDAGARHGERLCARFRGALDRIDLLTGTTVWGVFPERQLTISRGRGWQMLTAEHLVLATGAYEYTPPFPGWTLPGVMTPGGAQSLVKTWHVVPGKSAVVAGTGPFLLIVAQQLAAAGVTVRAVVEMARRSELWARTPELLSNPSLLLEGLLHVRRLARAGIPLLWGHVVCAAQGDKGTLRSVSVAPCDADGRPDTGRARTLEVDTLAVGYGFVPRIDLAQLAGCELEYEDELGGWIPVTDDEGETSVANVWVAGDGAGVAGAVVAELEGELVGLNIAGRMGLLDEPTLAARLRPIRRRLRRLERFRAALDGAYRVRPGLARLPAPETLACRCEEISCAEVDQAASFGGADYRTLKVMTRLGMGPCQGRMCWPAMLRRIADRTGRTPAEIGPPRFRPPLRPTTVGDLAETCTLDPALGRGEA